MDNVHQGIAGLNPYQAGKPIDELARELGISDIVKLASNENPRGPGEAPRLGGAQEEGPQGPRDRQGQRQVPRQEPLA